MNLLKRTAPFLIVVVTVTALYSLQHEETLSVGEAQYIEQFSTIQQDESVSEGTDSSSDAEEERIQDDASEMLQQHEPGDEINLAVFTSNSEDEDVQWEDYFPEEAQDQYEFHVNTFNIDDFQSSNSVEFVEFEEWTVINDQTPDLVVYEPLASRDASLEESMAMTTQIINSFDGHPVLKIPSYENAVDPAPYVQEWTEFAEDADVQYVGPDQQAISDSALTQGGVGE